MFLHSDDIRSLFSQAMSEMYRQEVPQYGALLDLVSDVNDQVLDADPDLRAQLANAGELDRLNLERHGAIRLGTAAELSLIRRMFSVMGMYPVGYYDLSVAGIPVHSTAFRPINSAHLRRNPFRVFTSLIRLDLVADKDLVASAKAILAQRQIVTPGALAWIETAEQNGGLTEAEAKSFVSEALETFRWHSDAQVDLNTYEQLVDAHRLIADVVSFRGPHINHLTPRTLDIDLAQSEMPKRGIDPKSVIEGPPRRQVPILLRQTSFKALEETVVFQGSPGTHTARFGEIEQRGVALTPEGRARYDAMLKEARASAGAQTYEVALEAAFSEFPDDLDTLRRQKLAFFRYRANSTVTKRYDSIEALIDAGALVADPQTYEDFLPVSAAGIFQSNLGAEDASDYAENANQSAFEAALGTQVLDEMALYKETQTVSLRTALATLDHAYLSGDD